MTDGLPYARHHKDAGKKNALALHPVVIYFQSVPGISHQTHGIRNAPYKLKINNADRTPANAKTDNEGKVSLSIPAKAKVELEIFGTTYELKYTAGLAASQSTKGIQQRLLMLGYHGGTDDDTLGPLTERAVLQFQADSIHPQHQAHCAGPKNGTLAIDGIAGKNTQKALHDLIKHHKGE